MSRTALRIVVALLCGSALTAGRQPSAPGQPTASEPTLFAPGQISTADFESHAAFADGGRTLYFLKANLQYTWWTIVVSRLESGVWKEPEVAPFSGRYNDADPFITPDGSRFFFISNRPHEGTGPGRDDLDIWVMDRSGAGWAAPRRLPEPVNSPASEWFPVLAASGTLYFGSGRPGGKGKTDIYRCSLRNEACSSPENLGDAINTAVDEFEAFVTPDERTMIVMSSGRPEGLGSGDLYISTRGADGWSNAQNLGAPINSRVLEIGPSLSADGRTLFFSSTRSGDPAPSERRDSRALAQWLRGPGNGKGDIYRVELKDPFKN
jgi:Tol biopolymer transport system component